MQKYNCKNCGAELYWDSDANCLKCEYCDKEYQVSEFEPAQASEEPPQEPEKTDEYAMLPVWLLNVEHNKKDYLFAINGETGWQATLSSSLCGKNTKADDNLISSGSGIDVQEGQCMILVENGKIVEFCAEPGRYTYDASSSPSLYAGDNKGLKALGKEILQQWSAGGQRFSTQRVYFINLGEIISAPIKWGCGDIAFHHTTQMLNGAPPIELDVTLKGNGQVTIKINDSVKFYTMIGAQAAGNGSAAVIRVTDDGIMSNLKSGIVDKIAEAVSTLGYEQPMPYTALRSKSTEIANYLNGLLSSEWSGERGFEICSFTVNGSFMPSEEDKDAIQEMQKTFTMGANMNAANYDVQKTMARGVEAAGQNGGANGLFGVDMCMQYSQQRKVLFRMRYEKTRIET